MKALALIIAVTGILSLSASAGEIVKRDVYYYGSDNTKSQYVFQSDRRHRSSRSYSRSRPIRSNSRRYYPSSRYYYSGYYVPVRSYSYCRPYYRSSYRYSGCRTSVGYRGGSVAVRVRR